MTVGIINYGLGNIRSLTNAIKYGTGVQPLLIETEEDALKCSTLFLPGVGAFGAGMQKIGAHKFKFLLQNYYENGGKIVGICLGMQLLFSKSSEGGGFTDGLNLIPGVVDRLATSQDRFERIPSIGWYTTQISGNSIFSEFNQENFYYVHSYHCVPENPNLVTGYYKRDAQNVSSIIQNDNVYGFQFHPEKSGEIGIELLKKVCDD